MFLVDSRGLVILLLLGIRHHRVQRGSLDRFARFSGEDRVVTRAWGMRLASSAAFELMKRAADPHTQGRHLTIFYIQPALRAVSPLSHLSYTTGKPPRRSRTSWKGTAWPCHHACVDDEGAVAGQRRLARHLVQ